MIPCDWTITTEGEGMALSTVDIDADEDGFAHDYGHELIEGTIVCDDQEWANVSRLIEAAPNMLSCLKMVLRHQPTALAYAQRIVDHCEHKDD